MKPLPTSAARKGRQAEARRNNERILIAARRVFLANPDAPMSAVAQEAGVGMSALYLRYRNKDQLLRHLSGEGLRRYISETETALNDRGDVGLAYASFMRRIVDADTHALVLRLAGKFRPSKELYRSAATSRQLSEQLFERARAARIFRRDITVVDIALIFEQLASIQTGDSAKTAELRLRHLAIFLDALRCRDARPIPGPAPTWQDINERWNK